MFTDKMQLDSLQPLKTTHIVRGCFALLLWGPDLERGAHDRALALGDKMELEYLS